MLVCRIVAGGDTTGCHVKSESVKGQAFGEYALRIWSRLKKPVSVQGRWIDNGIAYVPIHFRMEKPAVGQ